MADQPHDPVRHQILEEQGAFDVVVPDEHFADVMEEGSGPQLPVVRRLAGVFEHLERVKEGVALGVPTGILRDAVKRPEEFEDLRPEVQM